MGKATKPNVIIFNSKGTFIERKDLRALTLVGPPKDKPELEPLAVLHLYN